MSAKYKLNPKQRAWVRALRSGKYEQGKEALHRAGRFCCLGVACDLAVRRKWVKISVKKPPGESVSYGGHVDALPKSVMRAFGFSGKTGETKMLPVGGGGDLAYANDHNSTFCDIAKFVERHPEEVFTERSLIKAKKGAK